jgi:hypothetical protein
VDALRKTNNRRKETLNQMMHNDWDRAVAHEMKADSWYVVFALDEDAYPTHASSEQTFTPSKNGNGTFPPG